MCLVNGNRRRRRLIIVSVQVEEVRDGALLVILERLLPHLFELTTNLLSLPLV